jgi:glucokinase
MEIFQDLVPFLVCHGFMARLMALGSQIMTAAGVSADKVKPMPQDYVIGFDVGGTRLKYAAVTKRGKALLKRVTLTGANRGPDHLVDAMVGEVAACERKLGTRAIGMAFGISGAVDPNAGVVLLPGKFKELEGYPLVKNLRIRLKIPVVAENDGRISILAEKYYGQARKKHWVVCLTIGTGVGSGVMLDGQILRDPHLQFGTQAGHLVIQSDGGKLSLTGARGTAETLCSATALAMAVRDGLQRGIPSVLTDEYFTNHSAIDFAAVIRGVEQHDRLCLDELHRWTRHLGWLLVTAAHAYAPQLIILSGGATQAAQHFLQQLQEHLNAHLYRWPRGESLPIVVSKMGEFAGAMGAAGLAWETAAGRA